MMRVYLGCPLAKKSRSFQALQLLQGLRQLPRAAPDYLTSGAGELIQQIVAGIRLAKPFQRYHNQPIQIQSSQANGSRALPVSRGKDRQGATSGGEFAQRLG